MRTIVIMNNKGGVGKTVTAISLADILTRVYKYRVVLVDCDGQMNLTRFFLPEFDPELNLTVYDVLQGKGETIWSDNLMPIAPMLDLLPATSALYSLDVASVREGNHRLQALLNEHCGYSIADDEVLLLHMGGVAYFISDIGLRMLTPRELYNAMGFPADYIIDHDYLGKDYSKSAQVARCGNAVCPPVAGALVAANCKEQKQTVYIATMRELWERVAV